MVAAGMAPMQVIVAATKNGAEFLRIADAGTLDAGKSADLHRARRQPARRHHQHTQDRLGVSARHPG